MENFIKFIPILLMLILASWFFKLGSDWQKEKEVLKYVYIDSYLFCQKCRVENRGDSLIFINKELEVKGFFIK